MSVEKLRPEQAPDLTQYSLAALLVAKSRFERGNGSAYDGFLCSHIGDPRQADAPPISQIAPSGAIYFYNNPAPGQIRRSYSREGNMVTVRHVQGMPQSGDERYGFYVASLNLHSGEMVEWQVTSIQRFGSFGRQRTVIGLTGRTDLRVVDNHAFGAATLEAEIIRRMVYGPAAAQVVLDSEHGCSFQANGVAEELHDVTELVDEVNTLTDHYGLTPELDARRQRVGESFGTVVSLGRLAA